MDMVKTTNKNNRKTSLLQMTLFRTFLFASSVPFGYFILYDTPKGNVPKGESVPFGTLNNKGEEKNGKNKIKII